MLKARATPYRHDLESFLLKTIDVLYVFIDVLVSLLIKLPDSLIAIK